MPATQQITESLIQQAITQAVQNVCRVLIRTDVRLVEHVSTEVAEDSPMLYQVMGNVGFVGEANGIVYLCMSDEFAVNAVGKILGMSDSEVEFAGPEVLKDAIGEVTNMTVGGFKNALCDIGFPCKLTLPTIVRGHKLKVSSFKGTARYVYRFECSGHPLVADIQVKAD